MTSVISRKDGDKKLDHCAVKRGLNPFAKCIGSCQPALSAQADMSRNISPSSNFPRCQRKTYVIIQSSVQEMILQKKKKEI